MEKKNDSRLELRPVEFKIGYVSHAEGSCLVSMGETRVLCTATVEEKVPSFLIGTGQGWVTAEYGMLPRSTHTRQERERSRIRPDSRALEISRFIGRTLRMSVDLKSLGERTLILDCDVLQADGGTRCCAINGAVVALHQALNALVAGEKLVSLPVRSLVAAVSVGLVEGEVVLDLSYADDCRAEVDLNLVMTEEGKLVEIQGTAEKEPFDDAVLIEMLTCGRRGIEKLITLQKKALGI